MSLPAFAIRRPVAVSMMVVGVVVFGLYSVQRLALELLPDISYPTLTIRTSYPQAAPSEVEEFVSKPIEEMVAAVTNVVRVTSISKAGLSDVMVDFAWGTDMDMAAFDVREKVQMVASSLPEEVEDPVILRFDPTLDPILSAGVTSTGRDISELRILTERLIQRPLEPIPGIASVRVSGGLEDEIVVEIDESKVSSLGIPYSQIVDRLAQENVNMTGGHLEDAGALYLVRTVNQFKTWEEIGNVILGPDTGDLRLKDVARVVKTFKRRKRIARIDGQDAIQLEIFKEGGANTVTVCSAISVALQKIQDDLPSDVKLTVVSDQSVFIQSAIREVCLTGLYGGLFATIILYFFLRKLSNTIIIFVAIPLSVVATFNLMYLAKISLNMMSLGGLALGIGMLVDNSIVVLENIHRHRAMGVDYEQAAERGTNEVAQAVTASTFTSIAVFYPIVYVQGIAGQIFKDQAVTVAFSLLASLTVSLTVVPMMAAKMRWGLDQQTTKMKGAGRGRASHLLQAALNAFEGGFEVVRVLYLGVLKQCVDRPLNSLFLASVTFLFSLCLLPILGMELLPPMDQSEVLVDVTLPQDKPLEETDQVIAEIERHCGIHPEIRHLFSSVGAGSRSGSHTDEEGENIAQLTVALVAKSERDASSTVMIQKLRDVFADVAGVEMGFREPTLFTFRTPIEVEISGHDLQVLRDLCERVIGLIEDVPGLGEIVSSIESGYPEVHVIVDRDKASAYGLTVRQIAEQLREKLRGKVATRFSASASDIDILVRTDEEYKKSIADLQSFHVNTPLGYSVSLAALARLEIREGPSMIYRISQHRAALLSSTVSGRDLGSVAADVSRIIANQPIPPGYTMDVKGQNEEMTRSFDSLRFALLLAVVLVYIVLSSQFESLIHPFAIMFSIPFGFVGVIWALFLSGQTISVVVFIGGIILAGIVVNDAIVLVDFVNQLRRSGLTRREAILQAGPARLRPIIMTTATTVFGLVPLALSSGDGSEMRRAMACTIIGGMVSSTLLTLLLIPSVYVLLDTLLGRERKGTT